MSGAASRIGQRRAEVALAYAGLADGDDVVLGLDPLARRKLPDGCLVDAALRVADHAVERCTRHELRVLETPGEPTIVALGPLSVDDDAELLFEGKLVTGRRQHQLSDSSSHAGEPELRQFGDGLFDRGQCNFSLS